MREDDLKSRGSKSRGRVNVIVVKREQNKIKYYQKEEISPYVP